ncbi:MAG: nucleotide exchange factor GrpE [Terriglobia bacterium]
MTRPENLTEEAAVPEPILAEGEPNPEQANLDFSPQPAFEIEIQDSSEGENHPPIESAPEASESQVVVDSEEPEVEVVAEEAPPSETIKESAPSEAVEASPSEESALPSELQTIGALSELVKSLTEEKESLFDRLLRKQAEFENFRKRTEKEKQEFYEFAISNFIQGLLPVLDGLERSLTAQEGETVESFRKGNELILKQFRDLLWAAGIQPIRSMGKLFDPNFHQAVMREESTTLAENEIIEEFQRGYLFKDRLLRPSMVKVAVAPPVTENEGLETETQDAESPAVDEAATEG